MINSPRSLKACEQLGVEPNELYKLTKEKFKEKYPELINMNEKLIQIRYDAEEKFREETIKQVKEARTKIIEEEEKKKESSTKDMNKSNSKYNSGEDDVDKKWEKILENENKAIEKIKKKQRQNIESMIEEQINKELMIKVNEAKEIINKRKEEENEKALIEKRKMEEKERREKEKKK